MTTYVSHFVVTYNHTTKEFDVDDGTCDARFEEGAIYDCDACEWMDAGKSIPVGNADSEAYFKLQNMLDAANKKGK